MELPLSVSIGTAGWSIGRQAEEAFPTEGSALERYSAVFEAAEINSSFHRPHRASTWERWRESVPDDFRFSVKVPKSVTHVGRLVGATDALTNFLEETAHLREKLAVLLVQLPPSLAFDAAVAESFFRDLRQRSPALLAVEPRHATWFSVEAAVLLADVGVARVGADPGRVPGAEQPLVVEGLAYWRLHGSPIMYRSSYADRIDAIATSLSRSDAQQRWCIFDNTASSAATADALRLKAAIAGCRS